MNPTAIRKKSLTFQSKSALLPCAALVLTIVPGVSAQSYTLVPVNPPSGVTASSVAGLNNHGTVVGNTTIKVGRNNVTGPAFVWANGVSVALPSPGSNASATARDISDSGVIVGRSGGNPARAVWWQAGSGAYATGDWNALLPAGSPLTLLDTIAISHDGSYVVFDAMDSATGYLHPVVGQVTAGSMNIWSIDTMGGSGPVFVDGLASDIHSNGTIVRVTGWYALSGNDYLHGFLWEMNTLSGAVTMSELDNQIRLCWGASVNGSGEVAGYLDAGTRAWFWDASGAKQQLPTLGGLTAAANSINDAGFVVGWSSRSGKNSNNHGFLWHPATGTRDLNGLKSPADTSGLELTIAYKINDSGHILARGTSRNGGTNVLLFPAP